MQERDTQLPNEKENNTKHTRSERSQRTRDLICKATMEVIGQHGYRNANTTMIAKQAGVSRGALTHHFPTKVKLVSAAYEYLLKEWEDKRLKFMQKPMAPMKVEEYVRFLWKEIFNHPQHVAMLELMLAARGDKKLRQELNKSLKGLTLSRHELWGSVIGHRLQSDKNETLMLMTTCLLRGLSMQETVDPRPDFEKNVIEIWVDFLCHLVD